MKKSNKHGFRIVALCVAFSLLGGGIVYAAENWANIWVQLNSVNLTVNGSPVTTTNLLYNDTTYVPLRACAEMLGSQVGWDQDTNTASINTGGGNPQQLQAAGEFLHDMLQLESLGDFIITCQRNASSCSDDIIYNQDLPEDYFDSHIEAFNLAIDSYNEQSEHYDRMVIAADILGIDPTNIIEIYTLYSGALDAIKATFDNLFSYQISRDTADYIAYTDSLTEALTKANDGSLICYEYCVMMSKYLRDY